jgi:aryl-alcohol dehydrogenase-like predicted oxidoreductase
MQVRRIGGSGLVSSAVGLGSLAFAGCYGRVDEVECVRTVQHALDLGVTMLDTADSFSGGEVERLVGRAVAGRRDEALIATWSATRGRDDSGPEALRMACDASLRRLGVDHIDLYYLVPANQPGPIEASVSQLAELVTAGKIRYVGLSGASAEELRRAHAVHPITALAVEYSLWERQAEAGPLLAAHELGIGIVACRPLGRGFLAGRIVSPDQLDAADDRRNDSRFWRENLRRNRRLLQDAEQVATQKHLGLSRLALAWLLSRADDIVPIPSTRNRLHIEMNAGAVGLRLSQEECDALAALFPPTAIADGTSGAP